MSDGIHLTEYHERVRQWLVDKFSWLKLVESYPELTTPLVFLVPFLCFRVGKGRLPNAEQCSYGQP